MNWENWVSHDRKGIKCMKRLDLIISGYIKGGKIVQKMKNQLLGKKGESKWHQTYLLHKKLEGSGIKCIYYKGEKCIINQELYPTRIPFNDRDKRKASSLKQGFRNYTIYTLRKLLQIFI